MDFQHVVQTKASPAALRSRIHDLRSWPSWVDGLCIEEITEDQRDRFDMRLSFQTPCPLRVRLVVSQTDEGVRWEQVEGDTTEASGSLRIVKATSTEVVFKLRIGFPITIPGPLLEELEAVVLPRWLASLCSQG